MHLQNAFITNMLNPGYLKTRLPLLEYTNSLYPRSGMDKTTIIAVQHLLDTTHLMFRSWYDRGLKPKNIHVLGKCYSSNLTVMTNMRKEGIHVSGWSSRFHSHFSYDRQFDHFVSKFAQQALSHSCQNEKIILLDDGGHLIYSMGNQLNKIADRVAAVEQTSSGYEKLKELKLNFPIVNVARSPIKLAYEPPWVADVILEKTTKKLKNLKVQPKNVLIVGNGSIGCAIHSILKNSKQVRTYDKADQQISLDYLLPDADLVFGCTGTTSIPTSKHHLIKRGSILVSASSSDREFDSVHIRKKLPAYFNCHQDIDNGEVKLLNSGFPVNFVGEEYSVLPEKIQLIRALLTLGVLQASQLVGKTQGLVELDLEQQRALAEHFQRMK